MPLTKDDLDKALEKALNPVVRTVQDLDISIRGKEGNPGIVGKVAMLGTRVSIQSWIIGVLVIAVIGAAVKTLF